MKFLSSVIIFAIVLISIKAHYGDPAKKCQSDEVSDTLVDISGYDGCFPTCLEYNNCPTDLPDGTQVDIGTTAYGMCELNGPKPELNNTCMLMCKGVFGSGTCP